MLGLGTVMATRQVQLKRLGGGWCSAQERYSKFCALHILLSMSEDLYAIPVYHDCVIHVIKIGNTTIIFIRKNRDFLKMSTTLSRNFCILEY